MSARTRIEIEADLLAEGRDPDEVTLLALVEHEMIRLIRSEVAFKLSAQNLDRRDAEKYGTHANGEPRYAPEWYVAHGIQDGFIERLHGALRVILQCESVDEHGHRCIGSVGHFTGHWDGNGCNWNSGEYQ